MVVTLPHRTLGEVGPLETVSLNLGPGGASVQHLLTLREEAQALLTQLCPTSSFTTTDTVTFCLQFYIEQGPRVPSCLKVVPGQGSGFPVYVQLHLRTGPRKELDAEIGQVAALLHLEEESNMLQLLTEVLTYAQSREEDLAEFITARLCPRQCGVCGATASGCEAWCPACVAFHGATRPGEATGWQCEGQAGYCGLLDSLTYRQGQLYCTDTGGQARQFSKHSFDLCKKCRYRRCEFVGMKRTNGPAKLLEKRAGGEQVVEGRAGGEKTDKCCLVCSSSMVTGSLGVCRPCQVFLTDSVEESSQDSISCMRGGTCQVTAAKTVAFSACTGCWMARMKDQGVLQAFLTRLGDEQGHGCSVCNRGTVQLYQTQPCCTQCKKFFLRCAKSKCFKDFICSGGSPCSGVGSCSQCWWSKCVQVGLYSLYKGFGPVTKTKRVSTETGGANV